MYQIGISSNEPAPDAPSAEIVRTTCSADSFHQIEKNSSPKEALAELMNNDFKFEESPTHYKKAALVAATVLIAGSISFFEFSKPEKQYTIVYDNKEITYPVPDALASNGSKLADNQNAPNLGVDLTATGSVADPKADKLSGKQIKEMIADFPKPSPEIPNEREHFVKAGDTLYDIAKKYGTTVQELVAQNQIKDPSRLKLKTKLIIR